MDGVKDSRIAKIPMEILRGAQQPLFVINANNQLALGNYKYGTFNASLSVNQAAIKKGIEPKLFDISCIQVEEEFEPYPQAMRFYVYEGAFDLNEIALVRPINALRKTAFFREIDLLGKHTILRYNSIMRRWARSRFTQMESIGQTLCDVTNFKLLMHDYLSFHAAGIEIDGKGYLLTGLPDTGKTYTTIQLVSAGANFMSEDIVLIDSRNNAIGLPFTATMEKRAKAALLARLKAKVYELVFMQNYSKQTFFDIPLYNGENICREAPIAGIFFLKKGKPGCNTADRKKMLADLTNLNRLEFTYWRNVGILTYIFFDGTSSIDDYLDKEAKMLKQLVDSVPIYDVSAPDHTGFAPLISAMLDKL